VTSIVNITNGDIAVESIPRGAAFCYWFFCDQKDIALMPFHTEINPVYGDKCSTRSAIHVWCKKFSHCWESVDEPCSQQSADSI